MIYTAPKILAQSMVLMAECRPSSKPSGRPCNPPVPGGAAWETPLERLLRTKRNEERLRREHNEPKKPD